jgi:uncharacterized protein (DUF433 family)
MKLDRITFDPEVFAGRACVRGMRIPVSVVIKMLASGMSREQVLREHPDLTDDDITQCLDYAAALSEDRVLPLPIAS